MATPDSKSSDDDAPAPAAALLGNVQLSDPQVRALRIAVIVMGFLIVMGLVALIGRIIYLVARPSAQTATQSSPLATEVTASLPAGAQVRSMSLQGDRIAIHYDAPGGSGIVVVDLATGRTLSRVQLAPGVPKP
jgi:hypothetical protein